MKRRADYITLSAEAAPRTAQKHARDAAASDELQDDVSLTNHAAAGDVLAADASHPAKPSRRKSVAPSPHAGPLEWVSGEHVPITLSGLTISLPPRAVDATKVVSWNINGLRAAIAGEKRKQLQEWVRTEDADVLCLQEIKTDEADIAKSGHGALFPSLPHAYFNPCTSKKGYAGTALFCKRAPLRVLRGLDFTAVGAVAPDAAVIDTEGRVITAEFDSYIIVNVYVPNSGMKLERLGYRTGEWDPCMRAYLAALRHIKPVVLVGDLNVAYHDMDVHSAKTQRNKVPSFCDAERDGFAALLSDGFVDPWRAAHPTQQQFTYWSARFNARSSNKGWRLDYALVTSELAPRVVSTYVRAKFPSTDHVPIGIEFA